MAKFTSPVVLLSMSGSLAPGGTLKLKFCARAPVRRNNEFRAKVSPAHNLLPEIK